MSVMPSTVSSMYDLAVDLRYAVAAAMATTPAGGPEREFISLGEPPWDTGCAQAVVQIPTLSEGSTNPTSPAEETGRRVGRGRVNLVGLVAWAVRCIEASEGNSQVWSPPSDDQLSREARAAYEDGWAIWNWITRANLAGELFGGPCSIVHFDGGAPAQPAGGLGGWRFALRVELGGYDPLGS